MALATYSALRSSIRDWAVRDDLSDELIKDFVEMTETIFNYGDEENAIRALRVRDMQATDDVTVTDGIGDLPTDFLEAIKVKDPGGVTRDIVYAAPDWLDENFPSGQDPTYPSFYTIIGDELYCPIDVSLTYYQKIPTITGSDGTTNWLLTKAPNAYLYGGLMHYSIYDKDPQSAVAYRALMANALSGLQSQDTKSRAGRYQRRAGMAAF